MLAATASEVHRKSFSHLTRLPFLTPLFPTHLTPAHPYCISCHGDGIASAHFGVRTDYARFEGEEGLRGDVETAGSHD